MTIKNKMRRLAERLTGTHIYRVLPRGIDFSADIRYWLPNLHMETIFDVGANTGQSVEKFLQHFPDAHIYCFEPIVETFQKLQRVFEVNDRVHCVQLALAAKSGSGRMVLSGTPDLYHLSDPEVGTERGDQNEVEVVATIALDEYCAKNAIERISFLKIDTEGGDFEVLKGGVGLLSRGRVDLVEVEAGMNPANKSHVPLEPMKAFLEARGYVLFGLYEQVPEWISGDPNLRRVNAVFVSEIVSKQNNRGRWVPSPSPSQSASA